MSERYHGDRVDFFATDNGPGIPAEHLLRVFGPYVPAWRIVAAHGGLVSMSSRPYKGSTVGFAISCA